MDANEILKAAEDHFSKVATECDLRSVEVPEWGATLYFPAAISLLRKSRIMEASANGGLEHMAQIIIECARDEQGKPIFTKAHKSHMMTKVDSNVLIRVAGEMAAAMAPDEDIEGKSETTRS